MSLGSLAQAIAEFEGDERLKNENRNRASLRSLLMMIVFPSLAGILASLFLTYLPTGDSVRHGEQYRPSILPAHVDWKALSNPRHVERLCHHVSLLLDVQDASSLVDAGTNVTQLFAEMCEEARRVDAQRQEIEKIGRRSQSKLDIFNAGEAYRAVCEKYLGSTVLTNDEFREIRTELFRSESICQIVMSLDKRKR
jgi:hypothetical protein